MKIAVIDYDANVGGGRRYTSAVLGGLVQCDPSSTLRFITSKQALENKLFGNLDRLPIEKVGIVTPQTLQRWLPDGRVLGIPGTWQTRAKLRSVLARGYFSLQRQLARGVRDTDIVFVAWPDYLHSYEWDKPYLVTVHDLLWHHIRALPAEQREAQDRRASALFQNSRAIVALTPSLRDEMSSRYSGLDSKIHVIYSSLPELPAALPQPERRAWLAEHEIRAPFLLAVGSLWVHKNHSTLLKGFALLKQKLPELQLVCAGVHTDEAFARNPAYGSWSLAKDLRARAIELHLEPGRDVIGLGTVSDPVLGALYESAFCFIAASTYEGGSLPMLEAVARGCPVACSDIPVFRDIATFYGIRPFYFPPTDPAALAFAVQQLVSQPIPAPVLETMAARIRQRTWRDAAQEYLQVMRTVLAPAQPNSGLGALQPTSL